MNSIINNALETFYNFVIIDKHKKIVYMNKTYADVLGTTQEKAFGRNVEEVIPNTRMPRILKSGDTDIGSIFKLFNHITKKEQSIICNRYPIIENGEIIGVFAVTIFVDIDEMKKLNQEIEILRQKNEIYKSQLDELRHNKYSISNLLGKSNKMLELKKLVYSVADTNLAILLTGNTGTGKEVFANIIHQLSNRRLNNFIKINCAAIPKDLLESELFGYEEGAFTGASKSGKIGKFELANNGTLLLDEISEMPLTLQAKLLRVIQEKELVKVGGTDTIKLNIRLICSTNKNIIELVKKGKFREDLYYRINSVEMEIPPLRERLSDLPNLCDHFIKKANIDNGLNIKGMEDDVIPFFKTLEWNGNIRELENAIERACVIAKSGKLSVDQFDFLLERIEKMDNMANKPSDLIQRKINEFSNKEEIIDLLLEQMSRKETNKQKNKIMSLEEIKERSEKEEIIKAIEKSGGNKTRAAKLLNISRSVLYNRINKYNIDL